MPRTGRGGSRNGQIGKAYANRADLTAPKPLPVTTVPGQQYGAAGQQAAAQRAVPMAGTPTAPVAAPPSPGAPGANPAAAPPPVMGLPPGLPEPGTLPPLDAPTDRPDEHLMTGVNAGPGPGSEALTPVAMHPLIQGVGLLNSLGSNVSPQIKALRDALAAQMANQATP